MTPAEFLRHWSMIENPFRGEEARSDDVFARMTDSAIASSDPARASAGAPALDALDWVFHPDYEKILGDLRRPGSAVVFGEKGSGKTAIRLQIARHIERHNAQHGGAKVLLLPYDDLNATLDRLHDRLGGKSPSDTLRKTRLVDHLDALLHRLVPRVVDALLGVEGEAIALTEDARSAIKRLDGAARRDVLLLQAIYDRPDSAEARTAQLARRLRLWPDLGGIGGNALLIIGPVVIVGLWAWLTFAAPASWRNDVTSWGLVALAALYGILALKFGVWDRLALLRTAHRVRKQLRTVPRGDVSFARSIRRLPSELRDAMHLPLNDSDETRYALLDRLRRILRTLGYAGLIIIVDRVDEPTLISGDPERMKAVIWPMLNNKFLQQEGVGVKMLLPVELRHTLFRESSAFFQEARLDKQHMIERLAWTGTMLYELCEARMRACTAEGRPAPALLDLFAEDVTRQDLLDALEKTHQPRDAFKLMYRVIAEHCSSSQPGQREVRIPRATFQRVAKEEAERLMQVYRGMRPG